MDRPSIELHQRRYRRADRCALWTLNIKITPRWFYGALIIVLSVWILQSFLQALLAGATSPVDRSA